VREGRAGKKFRQKQWVFLMETKKRQVRNKKEASEDEREGEIERRQKENYEMDTERKRKQL
jgi:hypothetical protein